jgi:DNA-binding MarR family transcriptional regulator
LIEAVGKNGNAPKTISDIATELGITSSTVTVAINKLMKKGYVEKSKDASDGRSVNVFLSPLGGG